MAIISADVDGATVTGTTGDDLISGRASFASVDGGAGADTIGPLGGRDTVHGGPGDDSLVASTTGLTFGDDGADTIVGQPDETVNLIEGGPGNDLLDGDPTEPPPFIAYAMYTTASGGVRASLATSAAQDVGGGAGVDTLRHFNGLVGSAFADTLTAGAGAQSLLGGAGDDRLEAGPDGAEMHGGPGDDLLIGGLGGDTAFYDVDRVSGATGASGPLTVDLRITVAQDVGGGQGRDTLLSIDNLVGGGFGDSLTGSDDPNVMFGRPGADSISGLGGADTVFGDEDADTLNGNTGADRIEGGPGADVVRGGQGDDVVSGGDGNDFIAGDRGSDTLTGGAGGDIFHAWSGAGLDRVTDFHAGEGDRVFLLPGAAPAVSQVGADTVIDFGGGNQMVLAGVQLSSLPAGWIFGA